MLYDALGEAAWLAEEPWQPGTKPWGLAADAAREEAEMGTSSKSD